MTVVPVDDTQLDYLRLSGGATERQAVNELLALRTENAKLKDWIRDLSEKYCSLEVDAAQRETPDHVED